jgi:hypothetical protein
MILLVRLFILGALLFNAQAYGSAKMPSSAQCTSYLHMAMMEPLSELSSESATHKYLQYLGYFIEQHILLLDDLKYLRGFSKVANLSDIFAAKIPEAYVYNSDFEMILPFVEIEKVKGFLDIFIKAQSKDALLKNEALNKTEIVTGFFPVLKRLPHEVSIPEEMHFYGNEQGDPFLYNEYTSEIRNLNTGARYSAEALPNDLLGRQQHDLLRRQHLTIGSEIYLMNTRNGSIYENKPGYKIYARSLNTGKIIFKHEAQGDYRSYSYEGFKDSAGNPHIAWTDGTRIDQKHYNYNRSLHTVNLITGEIKSMQINTDSEEFYSIKWVKPKEGGLFYYYKEFYLQKGFLVNKKRQKLMVFDATQNGALVLEPDFARDENVLFFDRVNADHYIAYVTSKKSEKIVHFKKSSTKGWEREEKVLSAPFYVKDPEFELVKVPSGEVYLINLERRTDTPLHILNISNLNFRSFDYPNDGGLPYETTLLYKANGTPILVTYGHDSQSQSQVFEVIDFTDFKKTRIPLHDPLFKEAAYYDVQFLADGSLIAHFKIKDSSPKVHPEERVIVQVQLYGGFNPKTGEVGQ